MVDDEFHDLDEAGKRLPVPHRWWLGLQADLCNDERLSEYRGKGLRCCPKNWAV